MTDELTKEFLKKFGSKEIRRKILSASKRRKRVPSSKTEAKLQLLEEIAEAAKAVRNGDSFQYFQELSDICLTILAHNETGWATITKDSLVSSFMNCGSNEDFVFSLFSFGVKSNGATLLLNAILHYVEGKNDKKQLFDAIKNKINYNYVRED